MKGLKDVNSIGELLVLEQTLTMRIELNNIRIKLDKRIKKQAEKEIKRLYSDRSSVRWKIDFLKANPKEDKKP